MDRVRACDGLSSRNVFLIVLQALAKETGVGAFAGPTSALSCQGGVANRLNGSRLVMSPGSRNASSLAFRRQLEREMSLCGTAVSRVVRFGWSSALEPV